MSDKESTQHDASALGHLARALRHAEEAFRAYLSLIANKMSKLGASIVRLILILFALVAFALIGLIFAAYGLAKWLENGLHLTPGVGLLCVGVAMMCVVVVGLLLLRKGNGDES